MTLAPKESALAGAEPGQQRERDDRRRHVEVDRFLHGPAAFTRVFDVALERGQVRIVREGALGQLVEPGADHAAPVPDRRDLVQVELEVLRGVQDLVALGVGLEHPVLDAVVNHLDVVPRAGRADVGVAVGRRQRLEDRLAYA